MLSSYQLFRVPDVNIITISTDYESYRQKAYWHQSTCGQGLGSAHRPGANPAIFLPRKGIVRLEERLHITFKGRMFWIIPFKMSGKIIDIKPEKLLKYTLSNRDSGSASIVTDTLSFNDGWTTLEITDDVGTEEGAEKRYARSQKGWEKVLKGLKELIEDGA